MANDWSERALVVGVIAYAGAAVVGVFLVATTAPASGAPDTSAAATVAQVASTLAGAALVARGILSLHGSRADAYRWFMRGVLVWILVTQVLSSTARSRPASEGSPSTSSHTAASASPWPGSSTTPARPG